MQSMLPRGQLQDPVKASQEGLCVLALPQASMTTTEAGCSAMNAMNCGRASFLRNLTSPVIDAP